MATQTRLDRIMFEYMGRVRRRGARLDDARLLAVAREAGIPRARVAVDLGYWRRARALRMASRIR